VTLRDLQGPEGLHRPIDPPVALPDPRDDLLRLAVERPHADVERLVVVEDADLGGLGRRRPLLRLDLAQAARSARERPRRLVQDAVHAHGLPDAQRGERRRVRRRDDGDGCDEDGRDQHRPVIMLPSSGA